MDERKIDSFYDDVEENGIFNELTINLFPNQEPSSFDRAIALVFRA